MLNFKKVAGKGEKRDPFVSIRVREFQFFLGARLFFTLATQMQGVIVGWQVYQFTKDPLSLGMIGLAEAVPFLCIALFAGHVADIIERRKIILIASSAFALASFTLFYFTLNISSALSLYGTIPIYFVIFVTGLARGFLGPSIFAFLSQLVPRELYPNASTWNSTIWQAGAVIGPAIGGLLYGICGITVSYFLCFLLILLSVFLILFIRAKPLAPKEKTESLFTSLSAGIKFVFSSQVILGALSLDLFAVFFGGAVSLLPIFADQVLHTGPQGLGLLRAAPSFGAVTAAIIMAYKPLTINAGRNLFFSVSAFGLCMIVFALSANFYLSIFILALSGAFDNVSVVIRSTVLQLTTPDNMRGRVSSVNSVFIGSSNEIGEFESGVAAKLLGLIPSVIFGGTMTLIVVAVTGKLAPKLRKLNLDSL